MRTKNIHFEAEGQQVGVVVQPTENTKWTAFQVTEFVRDVRAARKDLDGVSRKLTSLQTILELITKDCEASKDVPFLKILEKQIVGIVGNCIEVVGEIQQTLSDHRSSRFGKWAQTLARKIKVETTEIRHDTSAIKQDTAQVIQQIQCLQERWLPELGLE
ncbi:hypothetical protein B0J14DRAFT_656322 [Halenospora varia]|nr:hypothetical protein B0J14DRAFT_656322 [Halenospora varia]